MHQRSLNRQTSIFATKPTHHRIKTQTDYSNENESTDINFIIKKTLRTFGINSFQSIKSIKTSNKTFSVKKPPAERSIFGQLNLHMPKFKKQNISCNEIQHPIKQYMNGVKERVSRRHVKRYHTGLNEGSQKATKHHLTSPPLRFRSEAQTTQTDKEKQVLYKLIDQIYKKIDKFKEVGYTEKKINEWIQKYCLYKRKYMTDLLMKSTNKHRFSQTQQDYFYQKDPQKVKEKISLITKKINGKQKPIDQYDLIEFSNHIEQILIQKNRLKISELRESITEKLDECFIYNRQRNEYQFGKKLYPADLLNFIPDMEQIEEKQGKFDKISVFNRQYFTDLGKTEKDIRSKIYNLIKITDNSKKPFPVRELARSPTIRIEQCPKDSLSPILNLKILQVNDLQSM